MSRLSANDKSDNEVKPGSVHRSPGISLTAKENSGKIRLGHRSGEALKLCPSFYVVHRSPFHYVEMACKYIVNEVKKGK